MQLWAFVDDAVAVRYSKDRNGPVLVLTPREWDVFVGGVMDGGSSDRSRLGAAG